MSPEAIQIKSFIEEFNPAAAGENTVSTESIEEFVKYFDKPELELKLLGMETALISNTENKVEAVQSLFRDMHSSKGTAAMLKLDRLTYLFHNLEDVLGVISHNTLGITSVKRTDIFDFFLQGFDLLDKIIATYLKDPDFVLKDSREIFGFYTRIIVEGRRISEHIDEFFIIEKSDDSLF